MPEADIIDISTRRPIRDAAPAEIVRPESDQGKFVEAINELARQWAAARRTRGQQLQLVNCPPVSDGGHP